MPQFNILCSLLVVIITVHITPSHSQQRACDLRNCQCPNEYIPFCGTDEITYPNRCSLDCAQRQCDPNLRVKFEGVCSEKYNPNDSFRTTPRSWFNTKSPTRGYEQWRTTRGYNQWTTQRPTTNYYNSYTTQRNSYNNNPGGYNQYTTQRQSLLIPVQRQSTTRSPYYYGGSSNGANELYNVNWRK